MNKIYALKYCYITNTIKVVSELTRRVCKGSTRRGRKLPVLSSLVLAALLPSVSIAALVSGNIPYQTYRDFAENKGQFQAGAINLPIFNKNGELVGQFDKAPMIDFSSVNVGSNPGVATLINPQYVASVKHNGGYQGVSFGDGENYYHIVDRNEYGSADFHAPRLNKLVTEVAPATMTGASQSEILNPSKYPIFYRTGSGRQYIQDTQGNWHWVEGSYNYLTGGTLPASFFTYGENGIQVYMGGNVGDHGVMASFGQLGDSGSPLFGWNAEKKQWELLGVYAVIGGGTNMAYQLIPQSFLSQVYSEDNDAPVFFNASSGAPLQWKFDSSTGTGSLKQGSDEYAMHGQKGSDLNAGKNLTFLGHNGQIDLENSVTQGAGSLTFTDDYTVTTSNGS
ncbi:S6 family peptidase, partial [Escherichia coli]